MVLNMFMFIVKLYVIYSSVCVMFLHVIYFLCVCNFVCFICIIGF